MRADDLSTVGAMAARVHPAYPEGDAVFAERLRLYPQGCRILEAGGRIADDAISHPWVSGPPPRLNSLLGGLPARPTTLLLHDVALPPAARGAGAACRLLDDPVGLARAAGLSGLCSVAVNGSAAFRARRGFRAVQNPASERELRGYDPAALLVRRDAP